MPSDYSPLSRTDDCSIFERALDALPDGVLLVDASRKIVYANSAFERLWKVPSDIFATRQDDRALQFVTDQLVDPEEFRAEVERLHQSMDTSEDELRFKDGRVISRRSVPFKENGHLNARIWIFTDITEARSATLDSLTRLPNRLAFSRDFPPFVSAEDDGWIRSIAIMDVDNFKKYNDLYGHAAGDEVLRQIGSILRYHLGRADDLVFRIGGEEFFMATRTPHEADAHRLFEAVRMSIAAMGREHRGNPPHDIVTASLGVGMLPGAGNPATVFEQVDAALYRAKAQGRNTAVNAVIL